MNQNIFYEKSIDFINSIDKEWRETEQSGWDVFDGLNSRIFKNSPMAANRFLRLIWIQLFKRSPLNLRYLTLVPKGINPKALALYISGSIELFNATRKEYWKNRAIKIATQLLTTESKTYSGLSFGYNFDWQARAFFVPAFKPNLICSVFAGNAFIDLYTVTKDKKWYNKAINIKNYILSHQILKQTNDHLCFSYIPGEKAVVHNVNLLAAAFLSRIYTINEDNSLREIAEKAVRYSVEAQDKRGAWTYGQQGYHQWVDNFHTGYNLTALYEYQMNTNDSQFNKAIIKGLDFHINHHFTVNDLIPKYTDKKLYPIDIHNFSQSIISIIKLKKIWPSYNDFLQAVIQNVFTLMYDNKNKYFYYQKNKLYTNKINYIRWGQAWMFLALSKYLNISLADNNNG